MNKQSLYVFGGALLATTALTTFSEAATIRGHNGTTPVSLSAAARKLATSIFGTSTTANNATVIGAGGNSNAANVWATANNSALVQFSTPLSLAGFRVDLELSGSATSFTGTPNVIGVSVDTAGTVTAVQSIGPCTLTNAGSKYIIQGCDATSNASVTAVGGLLIEGISFTGAQAMSTAGNSIVLGATVRDNSAISIDNAPTVNYITSIAPIITGFTTATTGLTLDNTVTPPYTSVKNPAATATTLNVTLGTIIYSLAGSRAADLSLVETAALVTSNSEIKITHAVLTDDALSTINYAPLGGTVTSNSSAKVTSGTVSFTLSPASFNDAQITVTFDGTHVIDATTGTATAVTTPTPLGDATVASGPAAFTGTLGQFTAGGLVSEVNTIQPSAGLGSTFYRSFVRIANQSSINGVVNFTLKNDLTGATLGTFTSANLTAQISSGALGAGGVLRAGSTVQISAADIEAAVPGAAATGAPYKLSITGAFYGYVQALMLNSTQGIFTDLSGFRNGGSVSSQP